MKQNRLLFTALIIICISCLCGPAQATIWRVNNKSNYNGSTLYGDNCGGSASYPVFAQINQAVTYGIVNSGDTLHVEGSTTAYDFSTITKKLVIIGTGYLLTDNPNTSSTTLETKLSRILFSTGSDGSQLIGVSLISTGNIADAIVYVNVNGIVIKRCRIDIGVEFGAGLVDIYILQNYFSNTNVSNPLLTNGNVNFVPPTEITFNNNICRKTLLWGTPLTNPTTFWPILQCINNVFDGPDNLTTPNLAFSTGEFKNNILMPVNAKVNISASAGNIAYNIGTLSTQFGTNDNNLVVAAITSIFITSTSTDGAYQVAPGSPANNSGSDGTDRGAFGGVAVINRYTLSGLAAIPVIYKITTSAVTSSSLPVTLSARTIK